MHWTAPAPIRPKAISHGCAAWCSGQHHHVSPQYLHQYAAHAAWMEDHRRLDNGALDTPGLGIGVGSRRQPELGRVLAAKLPVTSGCECGILHHDHNCATVRNDGCGRGFCSGPLAAWRAPSMTDNSMPTWAAPLVGFKSEKSAQMAAYFAVKAGGTIEKLKLIKLIYLSERRFISEFRHPMLYDELYSLPHGPICSSTLNGIDGIIHEDIWDNYIARNGNVVVARKNFERDEFDELSDAELKIIDAIWRRHKHRTSSQLRNYSHQYCSEYTEIEKGRIPITYQQLAEALEITDLENLDREIQHVRRLDSILSVDDPILSD